MKKRKSRKSSLSLEEVQRKFSRLADAGVMERGGQVVHDGKLVTVYRMAPKYQEMSPTDALEAMATLCPGEEDEVVS